MAIWRFAVGAPTRRSGTATAYGQPFPDKVKGGFVGVDVFFVISGFLITELIVAGLQAETFTFRDFYARRIRRIFPALAVVLAASFAWGWMILFADEFRQLGKHIAGAAGFVSNFVLRTHARAARHGVGFSHRPGDCKPHTGVSNLSH